MDFGVGNDVDARRAQGALRRVEKLQRGYEEMITMMGSVRSHLEQQSQRSERLLNILEGLPEALKTEEGVIDAVAGRQLTYRNPCWGLGDGPGTGLSRTL